jgi:hypothetical protein
MPPIRYPFSQDALDLARAVLERGDEMEEAIRKWMKAEGFGLETKDDLVRLVGPWLDT